jgi:hypothetical protein
LIAIAISTFAVTTTFTTFTTFAITAVAYLFLVHLSQDLTQGLGVFTYINVSAYEVYYTCLHDCMSIVLSAF